MRTSTLTEKLAVRAKPRQSEGVGIRLAVDQFRFLRQPLHYLARSLQTPICKLILQSWPTTNAVAAVSPGGWREFGHVFKQHVVACPGLPGAAGSPRRGNGHALAREGVSRLTTCCAGTLVCEWRAISATFYGVRRSRGVYPWGCRVRSDVDRPGWG